MPQHASPYTPLKVCRVQSAMPEPARVVDVLYVVAQGSIQEYEWEFVCREPAA